MCAWGTLAVVFVAAYWQGAAFASTKESATVWGGVLGLAAFFAWLAADADEEGEGEEEEVWGEEAEDEGEGGKRAKMD